MALIAQAATLEARVPFLHFFDGFRTSHEVAKVEQLTADDLRAMIDEDLVRAHRARALSPDRPVLRGTAQNPDVYFQAREAVQPVLPGRSHHRAERDGQVRRTRRPPVPPVRLRRRARCRARHHHHGLRRRSGPRDRGSPGRRRREGRPAQGPPLPALRRRSTSSPPCPQRSRTIAVLDRTKEPGATGEPLYCDVITALAEMGVAQEGHRRPLRPVLQGIHPRHGQGRLRRTAQGHAQEPLHRRHQRRRHPHQPGLRSRVLHRSPRHRARPVLRPGRGRHRGRQQELHQDHRRRDRQLRPGLLRLRLQEVRRHHHLAPALRPQADPLQLPDHQGQLRGLPPVLLPGTHRHAEARRARRHLPAQQPLRCRTRSGTSCRARCSSRSSTRS